MKRLAFINDKFVRDEVRAYYMGFVFDARMVANLQSFEIDLQNYTYVKDKLKIEEERFKNERDVEYIMAYLRA